MAFFFLNQVCEAFAPCTLLYSVTVMLFSVLHCHCDVQLLLNQLMLIVYRALLNKQFLTQNLSVKIFLTRQPVNMYTYVSE